MTQGRVRFSEREHTALHAAFGGFVIGVILDSVGAFSHVSLSFAAVLGMTMCVAISVLLGAQGRLSLVIGAAGAAATVFAVLTLSAAVDLAVLRWVRSDTIRARTLDAIVVLSGGFNDDSTLSPASTDRLLTGLALWRMGLATRLVTTREVRPVARRPRTSDYGQRRLVSLAGADSAWTIVTGASNTREEALRTASVLLPHSTRTIAVVTSPLHTRRACGAFEQAGFVVRCVPAAGHDFDLWHPRTASQRVASMQALTYEVVASLLYRRRGWLATE